MKNTPIPAEIVDKKVAESGISSVGKASIREVKRLINEIEQASGKEFVRMEMGIPGLPPCHVGVEAQIEALKKGVAAIYPDIEGIPALKQEAARFVKNFIDLEVEPENCIPTVGSMMGGMAGFMTFVRCRKERDTTLFINPNNPSWICFTEEELQIIGDMANKYDVFVFEDLAYFGMDFRQNISAPGIPPYQPSVGKYTDNYALLISGSKAFSYAGERIALMIMSKKLYNREFDDLEPYFRMKKLGRAIIYGTVYAISSGVAHSAQYALAAILKGCNDGTYNYIEDVKEYGEKAAIMKKMFLDNGFEIVYDKDGDKPLADGFYFTVAYPDMSSEELLHEFLYYGVSAISLSTCGSDRSEGLRACVSLTPRRQFPILEERLKLFKENH